MALSIMTLNIVMPQQNSRRYGCGKWGVNYAECHHARCHFAKCRGALSPTIFYLKGFDTSSKTTKLIFTKLIVGVPYPYYNQDLLYSIF
jgi:hypothetical protein